MALPEGTNKTENRAEKKHEPHKPPEKKEKPLTKVVIRRLPPTIVQETFLQQIAPVPDYDYIYTVKGDASLGENAFSRVYINFTHAEDIYNFKEKFDGYVFLDNRGHEYPAVVEFAAFQKIPKKRNKVRIDPKNGTIESDPLYLEFVELLNKPPEVDPKAEYSYQLVVDNKGNAKQETTPLLEYIKNKRAEKMRIREERREERKRRELERKRIRDDERRKRCEEKSPIKSVVIKPQSSKSSNSKDTKADTDNSKPDKEGNQKNTETSHKPYEKVSGYYKNKEKKFEDRKKEAKSKYPARKEYSERREFKSSRRDDFKDRDYRSKHDEYRKETEKATTVKKVKKYSEKREERKEALKAEHKKNEDTTTSVPVPAKSPEKEESEEKEKPVKEPKKVQSATDNSGDQSPPTENSEKENKNKEADAQSQKRIRNKDRPTLAIYRPGMLSKRRQNDGEKLSDSSDNSKDAKKEENKEV